MHGSDPDLPLPLDPPDASAAPLFAGYRILHTLGRGGLGEVHAALAPDGRPVALKTFLMRADDLGLTASAFVRETTLGLRLEHPDIVKLLDSGCFGDYAFLVMELVPGHDLSRHTRASTLLPPGRVVQVLQRVAGALAAAHALHVVHRDIKPGNVLVDLATDTVKLSDFGLARLGDAFRSRTGVIAGTPNYMSPEQLLEGDIGPRSDLYSLGVLAFELLTGRLPHEGHSLGQLLANVAQQSAPPLRRLRPELPADLEDLVARLLARQPERRPGSAREVQEALQRIAGAMAEPDDGPKSRR